MRSSLREAIIKTIAYGDIFQYPLRAEEIIQRLIGIRYQVSGIRTELRKIKQIEEKDGYYYLSGRHALVPLRRKRTEWSKKKLQIARRAAAVLSHIPTLKLIGISGGLASYNVDEDDDIDLFFITAADRMWTSRLFVIGLLEVFGFRRRPGDTNVKNKICANMMIDESHLTMPAEEQDLFGAYEVSLMMPLWQRDRIHDRFLEKNRWVRKWLPNFTAQSCSSSNKQNGSILFSHALERMCSGMQLRYMDKRRTTEIVEDGRARFHPHDARKRVTEDYRKILRRFRGI